MTLRLVNPGLGDVTVRPGPYDDQGTHWLAPSVDVPATGHAELEVTWSGAGCSLRTPWRTGHLTADSGPLRIPVGSNEQC